MACSCMIGSHFTLYDRKILTGSLTDLESIQPSIGIGMTIEPVREISNIVVCATSKASDQLAHMRSLIRAFASRLSII